MTSERTRNRMVERLRQAGIKDERVLMAMQQVPRHLFVEEALSSRAYEDVALPIGHGQTISQPYVVARMIELLFGNTTTDKLGRVLEIGLGCGYQTAVLAMLAEEVYAIERIAALVRRARTNLTALRLNNVKIRHGDGQCGWPEVPTFNGIVVAAATNVIPQAWLDQLSLEGRLILPMHTSSGNYSASPPKTDEEPLQQLTMIEHRAHEHLPYQETRLEPVRFVPLLSGLS